MLGAFPESLDIFRAKAVRCWDGVSVRVGPPPPDISWVTPDAPNVERPGHPLRGAMAAVSGPPPCAPLGRGPGAGVQVAPVYPTGGGGWAPGARGRGSRTGVRVAPGPNRAPPTEIRGAGGGPKRPGNLAAPGKSMSRPPPGCALADRAADGRARSSKDQAPLGRLYPIVECGVNRAPVDHVAAPSRPEPKDDPICWRCLLYSAG